MVHINFKEHFHIMYKLGEKNNHFSETYIAKSLDIPEHPCCVVKKLRSVQIKENTFELFQQQGKILTELSDNHPHLIPKLHTFCWQKTLFGLEKTDFYIVQGHKSEYNFRVFINTGQRVKCKSSYSAFKIYFRCIEYLA